MENKKKTIFNVIFLLVVFAGTMYGVFHGEDIGEIVKILGQVNVLWLIPGVICVVVFIWGESIIIYYMTVSYTHLDVYKRQLEHCSSELPAMWQQNLPSTLQSRLCLEQVF